MTSDRVVVSNAGPLMALSKLNLLHLLKELYGFVHIPRSVYREVIGEGLRQGYEDARTLKLFLEQTGWEPEDAPTCPEGIENAHLDRGERNTLALAISLGSSLVLMDELQGREIARKFSLKTRGTLGVLIEAYSKRLINADQLRFYGAELSRRNDIWISPVLVEKVLRKTLEKEESAERGGLEKK
jgi:predicted nucleic acid-binding protein